MESICTSGDLIKIEKLVLRVMAGYVTPERGLIASEFMPELANLVSKYSTNHRYSEHIEAFWMGCEAARLLDRVSGYRVSDEELRNMDGGSIIYSLVSGINAYAHGDRFKRMSRDRRYEMRDKNKSIQGYAREMLAKFSRFLVLRGDMGYVKNVHITIDDVFDDLDELLDLMHCRHGIFENAVGHAWCIEQGLGKGFHIHFMLLLSGSKHRHDGLLGKMLGSEWLWITNGLGTYHNCNYQKDKYSAAGTCGIGMIHSDNSIECENFINAAAYLADPDKKGQQLRMKPANRRAFATGIVRTV